MLGLAIQWSGDARASIAPVKRTIELSPHDQRMWTYLMLIAVAHLHLQEYEAAIEWFEQSLVRGGDYLWLHTGLAVAHTRLGHAAAAEESLHKAQSLRSNLSVSSLAKTIQHLHPEYLEDYLAGLREAGLEE